MTPPQYQTVFEIGVRSFPWFDLLHPCLFVVLPGILLYQFSKRQWFRIFGLIAIGFGMLVFLILCAVLIPRFFHIRGAYRNGRTSVVEGTIENFHPLPPLGPSKESFSVGSTLFSYYVGESTPCFTDTPPHRGPIRSGLKVRVSYNNDCIQRLEIQK